VSNIHASQFFIIHYQLDRSNNLKLAPLYAAADISDEFKLEN